MKKMNEKTKGLSPRTKKILETRARQICDFLADGGLQGELNLPHQVKVENPAIEFTKDAKAGRFDSLTDEEYQALLDRVEYESRVNFEGVEAVSINISDEWSACCNSLREALEHIRNIRRANECECFDLAALKRAADDRKLCPVTQLIDIDDEEELVECPLPEEEAEEMEAALKADKDPSQMPGSDPGLILELKMILKLDGD